MVQQTSNRPEIDEKFLEGLRRDPEVIWHRQTTTKPYVPQFKLTAPVDELWLAGRRDDDEVAPYLRGVDE